MKTLTLEQAWSRCAKHDSREDRLMSIAKHFTGGDRHGYMTCTCGWQVFSIAADRFECLVCGRKIGLAGGGDNVKEERRGEPMIDIKQLLDGIRLSQCGWENSEDIMTFNGTPIGATISQNVEIDRWWPSLKEELSLLLAPAIEAAVAAARKEERKRCRDKEVFPLLTAVNAMQQNLRDQMCWGDNAAAVEAIQKEKP